MARSSSASPKLMARVGDTGLIIEQRNFNVVCDKGHEDVPHDIRNLPHNQKHRYRHICAACAYEKGYADGLARAKAVCGKCGSPLDRCADETCPFHDRAQEPEDDE